METLLAILTGLAVLLSGILARTALLMVAMMVIAVPVLGAVLAARGLDFIRHQLAGVGSAHRLQWKAG